MEMDPTEFTPKVKFSCLRCMKRHKTCSRDASGCEQCYDASEICSYERTVVFGRPPKKKRVEAAEVEKKSATAAARLQIAMARTDLATMKAKVLSFQLDSLRAFDEIRSALSRQSAAALVRHQPEAKESYAILVTDAEAMFPFLEEDYPFLQPT